MLRSRTPRPPGRPSAVRRLLVGAAVVATAGAAGLAFETLGGDLGRAAAAPGAGLSSAQRSLLKGRQWVNTPPLRPEDLRGKVVLVNFWTYSCINSLRPLPYVREWARKYKNRGLVVVGVHTPEFGFEKEIGNVRQAVADLGVGFPVVLDNDYATWRAYGNEAWPAFYFVGADGRVHKRVLGEGGYDQSERVLQQLLAEATGKPVTDKIVPIAGRGPQAAPDWANLRSPEAYVGHAKAVGFRSPGGLARDAPHMYRPATQLALNTWSLTGAWSVGGEYATLTGKSGALTYRFHARDLNLVMTPPADGRAIRFRVRIDGADPGPNHGFDIDAQGWGRLDKPRMYQLVRQTGAIADRTFEIEFLDGGARAYVFTFG